MGCKSRRRMRSLGAGLLLLVLLAVCTPLAQANQTTARLLDEAGLLTAGESAEIQELLERFSREYELSIIITTTEQYTNNPDTHAVDLYRTAVPGDYGAQHGVSLYINMNTRDVTVAAHDDARTVVSISDTDWIRSMITPLLSDGDYAAACAAFIGYCGDVITAYHHPDTSKPEYDFSKDADIMPKIAVFNGETASQMAIITLAVTGIGMLILLLINQAGIRKNPPSPMVYIPSEDFRLTAKQDSFLRTRTSRTARPKEDHQNKGGGGGHTFSSGGSGGGSHGSRGKF